MKALRVQVDFQTGRRAGGINPKDRSLATHPSWQNPDMGIEITLVRDGHAERFQGMEGIEILDGREAIDAAVQAIQPEEQFSIKTEGLLVEYIRQASVDIRGLKGKSMNEVARDLFDRGCPGVVKRERRVVTCDVFCKRYEIAADSSEPRKGR